MQNQIDIELQRYSEESSQKDVKIMKVVHDLKNPILSLKNMLKMSLDENQASYEHELEDMEEMLDDLRTEFKFKNHMQFNESASIVKTRDLLQSFINTHQSLAKAQNNLVKYTAQMKFPDQIIIERSIVKRILNNFISNALKHTKGGEVKIELQIEDECKIMGDEDYIQIGESVKNEKDSNMETPMRQSVFEVNDTGKGIPLDKLRNIFSEKVSDENEANWEGTGLGLPICSFLSSQINGFIRYNSTSNRDLISSNTTDDISPSKFTWFRLYLPLKPGYMDEILHTQSVEQDYRTSFDMQQNSGHVCNSIILVEDNLGIMKMQKKTFEQSNMNQIAFNNAQDCLKQVEYLRAQVCSCQRLVIVTDLVMPGMTGQDMAFKIRNMDIQVPVYIVLATAEEGLNSDNKLFDEIWEKPISSIQFKNLYNQHQNQLE